MRAWLLALVLAGCGFQAKPGAGAGTPPGDDAPADASVVITLPDSAPIDPGAQQACVGSFVKVCVEQPTDVAVVPTSINTDTATCVPYTATPNVDACVIAGTSITMNDKVVVTGKKKLILLSTSSITLNNLLDVASHLGGTTGPGADVDTCGSGDGPAAIAGGAGGGLGNQGADGGGSPFGRGGQRGDKLAAPTTLRGGCAGSSGNNNSNSRGHGGGGVLLVATNTITIDSNGSINASGSSGTAGGQNGGGGGGGGGSGGMIVLDAPSAVTLNGKCFANAGAGAGAGTFGKSTGTNGTDSDAPDHVAKGGDGKDLGGNGGDGAVGLDTASNGTGGQHSGPVLTGTNGGGGGGGGGLGVIEIITKNPPPNTGDLTKISPTPLLKQPPG